MKPTRDERDEQPFPGLSALKQVTPPPSLLPGVMQRIAEPRPVSFWSWIRRPRRIELRLSPLSGLFLASAAACALFALSTLRPREGVPIVAQQETAAPDQVLVRFVLVAKGAKKVSVVGDFNAWDPAAITLVDSDGQGTFVATVPLRRGAHEYMFLVDGRWMTDPSASETRPDGFGRANGILRL
jgi:hypothetical protein